MKARNRTMPPCAAKGCNNPSHARGMCPSHYNLWRRGANDPALQEISDRWLLEKRRAFTERSAARIAAKALTNPAPAFDADAALDAELSESLREILREIQKSRLK